MANPETILDDMRRRCTEVFYACRDNLTDATQDRDDFVAEKGAAFFTDWFGTTTGYDITLDDMTAALEAMDDLRIAFEAARARLQVVRLR